MNVLVLMADHLRYDAMGWMGNRFAHTPNLDRLARRSVCFDRCYTQAPVCGPARHSLATGQYVHRHGATDNRAYPYEAMSTVAHAMEPLGYRRHQNGHMHWNNPSHDTGEGVGYEPATATNRMWRDDMPEDVLRKHYDPEHAGYIKRTTGGPSRRTREHHWGHKVVQESTRLIRDAVQRGEPFFSWTSFTEPHPAFRPPRDLYELNDPRQIPVPHSPGDALPPAGHVRKKQEEWAHLTDYEFQQIMAGYYGMVALVDEYIGQVIHTLEELGIRDETIIIFTSDHGDQQGEHGMFLKFVMYEASVHVPLMIDAPGVEPGRRNELVEHVDLLPTICDLVGAEPPSQIHGRSLVPLLHGEDPGPWRDAVFSQFGPIKMIRTDRWKLNTYEGVPDELYDLEADPGEHYNRIDDPAYAEQVDTLHQRLKQWEEQHAPPADPARPAGGRGARIL